MNEQNQKYYVYAETFKKCRFYLKPHSNANETILCTHNKIKRVCLNKNGILFYNKNGIFMS